MRHFLILFVALLCAPHALASVPAAPSYDPVVLARSFAALAGLVIVVTQFAKQHLLEKALSALADTHKKWATIALAFVVALMLAFGLQFGAGGITDPLFAAIVSPLFKALAYGVVAGLSAAGFHGFASGIAQNIGKAIALALALRKRPD